MFCHEMWSEELEIVNYRDVEPEDLPQLTAEQNETLEEYSGQYRLKEIKTFQFEMPCKFEQQDHGEKDMLAYYILYNMTLAT